MNHFENKPLRSAYEIAKERADEISKTHGPAEPSYINRILRYFGAPLAAGAMGLMSILPGCGGDSKPQAPVVPVDTGSYTASEDPGFKPEKEPASETTPEPPTPVAKEEEDTQPEKTHPDTPEKEKDESKTLVNKVKTVHTPRGSNATITVVPDKTKTHARVFNPRDTRNNRGTYGDRPSFLRIGISGSQLNDGSFLEGRYLTSLGEFMTNLPAIAEAAIQAQEARYFRDEDGQYRSRNLSLGGSLMTDLSAYRNDARLLAPGVFAEFDFSDFEGSGLGNQFNFKIGPRLLFKAKKWHQTSPSWQTDLRLAYQHRETNHEDTQETGNGVALDALASAYLGNGVTAVANGGISFMDSRLRGHGYDVDVDDLSVQGGLAVIWNPNKALQLSASLEGMLGHRRYDDQGRNIPFKDDKYAIGELAVGAEIEPLAYVFKYDKEKTLFVPYFTLEAHVTQSPYKKFDPGISAGIGVR